MLEVSAFLAMVFHLCHMLLASRPRPEDHLSCLCMLPFWIDLRTQSSGLGLAENNSK